jgi:hypothetical protein
VNNLAAHLANNWKTTVQGILSLVVTVGLYFTALPTGAIPQHTAAVITIATGLAKAILGLIQSDGQGPVQTVSKTTVAVDGAPVAQIVTNSAPAQEPPHAS